MRTVKRRRRKGMVRADGAVVIKSQLVMDKSRLMLGLKSPEKLTQCSVIGIL